MPSGESGDDDANDAGQHGEEDVVDGHKGLCVFAVAEYLAPNPCSRCGKTYPTKDAQIYEEEDKGLVVAEANTGSEPGTVVVHFQNAALARGAMVGAIGFFGLALVAKAQFAGRGLDGKGCVVDLAALLRGQVAVAIFDVERGSGVGEDGGGVAPVEHEVEEEAKGRGCFAGPGILRGD